MNDIINSLVSLPSTDGNFLSALNSATVAQLKYAIQIMSLNKKGQNASRIKACENKIASLENTKKTGSTTTKATGSAPRKEPEKIEVKPIDKSKKPKVIPFKTRAESGHTVEECRAKLEAELKKFTDNDSAYVVEAILERCEVDEEFRNNVMRKEKTYEGFFKFMFNAAKNGYCVKVGNIGGSLDKDTAIDLAFDYFSGEEEKPKATATTATKIPTLDSEDEQEEQEEPKATKKVTKKVKTNTDEEYEQLSLFGF